MPTSTRKVTLYPTGDKEEVNRVYDYIRNGMRSQNLAMNQYISALYMAQVTEVSSDDRKELNRLYTRISTSTKGSAYTTDIEFAKGLSIGTLGQKVRQDFGNAMKKGLMYGRISLPTYREGNPLLIHADYVRLRSTNPHKDNGLYHEYENHQDFLDAMMNEKEPKVFIKFVNDIKFKVVFGAIHKSLALRNEFIQIFEENYKVQGSSIQFDKRAGKKIMLNMSMEIPKDERKDLDENICVGVDLGMAIPAMCALNDDLYTRCKIGYYDEFVGKRTKMQAQKRRIQANMRENKGGHGRKKKLAHLGKIQLHERQFAKTYNHTISKRVIDFALKNHAKYINIEDLSLIPRERKDEFALRNWSYYELQQMIKYKANKYGIIVRLVNPAYTSQKCSVCGELGIRKVQSEFKCINPDCKCHKIYEHGFNADFNAARNIAMSTDFTEVDGKQIKRKEEKAKKERKYKQANELKEEIA